MLASPAPSSIFTTLCYETDAVHPHWAHCSRLLVLKHSQQRRHHASYASGSRKPSLPQGSMQGSAHALFFHQRLCPSQSRCVFNCWVVRIRRLFLRIGPLTSTLMAWLLSSSTVGLVIFTVPNEMDVCRHVNAVTFGDSQEAMTTTTTQSQ